MLKNKCIYISNVSSNTINLSNSSSSVPNTLFELMKENVLLVENYEHLKLKAESQKVKRK